MFEMLIPSLLQYRYVARAKRPMKIYKYTWEISNFLEKYEFSSPLISPDFCGVHLIISLDEHHEDCEFSIFSRRITKGVCYISLNNSYRLNISKKINVSCSDCVKLGSIPIIYLKENAENCLSDNILKVFFTYHTHDKMSSNIIHTIFQSHKSLNIKNINNNVVLDNSTITFIIGDRRLYADKTLLCQKSSVFEAMFNSQMMESITNEVHITDIRYDIFKLLLSHIRFHILPNFVSNDTEILSELLIAADKYDINSLKYLCESELTTFINSENYTELLAVPWLYSTTYLKDFVLRIEKNVKAVQQTNMFRNQQNPD